MLNVVCHTTEDKNLLYKRLIVSTARLKRYYQFLDLTKFQDLLNIVSMHP